MTFLVLFLCLLLRFGSKYGLKPKGDYDPRLEQGVLFWAIRPSKYGLKPKGDYDYNRVRGLTPG